MPYSVVKLGLQHESLKCSHNTVGVPCNQIFQMSWTAVAVLETEGDFNTNL